MLWNSNEDTSKILLRLVAIFNAFVTTRAVSFCATHGQNKTRKYDIKGFLPFTSLNRVVGSPSLFIKPLIGSTGKYDLPYKLT